MLRESPAFSGFSVDDIANARAFYASTLGVDVSDGEMGGCGLGWGWDIRVRLSEGKP